MHRFAALLLCSASLVAAPAPFPRPPRASGPWIDGWDRLVGAGRFDRAGDRRTVTVSGGRGALLRDVEGDFTMQVRVGALARPSSDKDSCRAGLLLVDVKSSARGSFWARLAGPPIEKPAFLRLERRGSVLTRAFSEDGKEWDSLRPVKVPLSRKLKVGVVVENTTKGSWKAEFDEFKLTPLR
jgi:regulation of enolase protein 1 (concanavalin A-like superfamily)